MTNEQTQQWAREAGMKAHEGFTDRQGKHTPAVNALNSTVPIQWLQAFATLVRNATLEEATTLCEQSIDHLFSFGGGDALEMCADRIRSLKT